MDEKILIRDLRTIVKELCESGDWDQLHNPKDLSIGIVTEAAELINILGSSLKWFHRK